MTSRYFPLCNHITSVSQPHNPKKPPYINLLSSNNCQQLTKSKLSFYHYCFLNQQNNTKKCGQRHMHLFLQTPTTKLMTATKTSIKQSTSSCHLYLINFCTARNQVLRKWCFASRCCNFFNTHYIQNSPKSCTLYTV